jgi:endothelin-converting enzyme/putative endopeptidase
MSRKIVFCFATIIGAVATAQAAEPETPLRELPYTPGLDVRAMDRSVDPCVDFYQFACGGWMKANPIPADQPSWDVYGKLAQDNQRFLWGILQELAAKTEGRNANQQKIGDFFAACMDEAAVEKLGAAPLKPYFAAIDGMVSKRDVPRALAHLHLATGDAGLFFGFGSNQDFSNSTQVIAFASHGGLGLPERDYYLKDDEKSQELRAKYVAHVTKMFGLLGDPPETARRNAAKVMEIEMALATASLSPVDRRDPQRLFNKMDRKTLVTLTRAFDWNVYLRTLGLESLRTFNVTQPEFYKAMDQQIASQSLADLKVYLRWHVAHAASPYLASPFVNETFDFFSRTLRGIPELRPRWKRCVSLVDSLLGEALGQEFVRRTFPPEQKQRVLRMTKQIEEAMRQDIRELPWMSERTKAKALEKLKAIVNKIGYPEKWRDYGAVAVKRDDFFGNVERAQRFESRRDLAKIGKPLDRQEWYMTPPTVNAYFDPQMNDINFPAGVLQPPLFDPKMDDAPNYGNTGGTIGHELTHGFDDQGRKFDAKGNLVDWWTADDDAAFRERAKCIADQYGTYTIIDDIKINPELTLGEDVADLGGVILAWTAWKAQTAGQKLEERDGLTPEQRFFVGYSQWGCQNDRPENTRHKALTDQHSPAKWRTNGLVVNLPEFEKAFNCKAGQPMVAEKRCRVW